MALGAYSGYWRFGYDDGDRRHQRTDRLYFKGALDETQIYDSVGAVQRADDDLDHGH